MNASLVTFYGTTPKPPGLQKLIIEVQDIIERDQRLKFARYELGQVHATIAGLEGLRVGNHIVSTNFAQLRGNIRILDPRAVVQLVQSSKHLPVTVRLGGFDPAHDHSFRSRGLHPAIRSFSIQGRMVVAMGWPVAGANFPPSLDLLRRDLARAGALHKYHASEGEVDNDFFFVLGVIERRERDRTAASAIQEAVRKHLSESKAVDLVVSIDELSFVAYDETTLAPGRTRQFSLQEIAETPELLINLYEAAEK